MSTEKLNDGSGEAPAKCQHALGETEGAKCRHGYFMGTTCDRCIAECAACATECGRAPQPTCATCDGHGCVSTTDVDHNGENVETWCPTCNAPPTRDDAFAQSFDARDWAAAFVRHVVKTPSIATDEGTMATWFANSIMRGYDERQRRLDKEQATPPQTPEASVACEICEVPVHRHHEELASLRERVRALEGEEARLRAVYRAVLRERNEARGVAARFYWCRATSGDSNNGIIWKEYAAPPVASEALTKDPAVHELKTWPRQFAALVSGDKGYEIRRNDRPFNVGDTLLLREWDPIAKTYTGATQLRTIAHITTGPDWGLPEFLCVLGFKLP